jgi:hypothetical protein
MAPGQSSQKKFSRFHLNGKKGHGGAFLSFQQWQET